MYKVYSPQVLNLGDFLNAFPVLSGLSNMASEPLRLVVPGSFRQFNGFREFMEFQPCIGELVYRDEVIGMEDDKYIWTSYSAEEFRDLTERPNRPIETMRHERFIRDNYPNLNWQVDDDFALNVLTYKNITDKWIVGDRWDKVTDTRRDWNILQNSGLFDDETKFEFLDYTKSLLENCTLMCSSTKPFIGTFTGSGMMADLMFLENYCVWDDSMVDWNGADIEYSYWKHYYGDRSSELFHISDPFLRTL